MVVYEKKTRIAQYGQWDHYPSGQGATILNFLKTMNRNKFIKALSKVRFFSDIDRIEFENYRKNYGNEKLEEKYWALSRDHGGGILQLIYETKDKKVLLVDSTAFAGDGLFCEYAYVIDLDENVFEIYRGFHKSPPFKDERFAFLPSEGEYYPVHLLKKYSLNDLPSDSQMIKDCNENEEE